MKKTLCFFVTILCLLALLSPVAAFCMQAHPISQPICSHCPQKDTHNHSLPACCSAHQQLPSSIVTSPTPESFLQHGSTITPLSFNTLPNFPSPLPFVSKAPPHRSFPIVLRI
jgi:hypothetical protein